MGTAQLTYPLVFVFLPLNPYAVARRTFVWGDHRYRWPSKFEVEIFGKLIAIGWLLGQRLQEMNLCLRH